MICEETFPWLSDPNYLLIFQLSLPVSIDEQEDDCACRPRRKHNDRESTAPQAFMF